MTINAIGIIPVKTDGCPTMGDYAIKKKMTVKWGKHKKGDIVLFDFNHNGTSDHIGIVEAVNKNGTITTIEGNTGSGNDTNGGQVQRRTRKKRDVNYFVRPKYTENVTAEMVVATAREELGITEKPAGSNKVKYNRWFYGKNISAYWCCTFVCWCFAHVREPEVIPVVMKPTNKYTGEIPKGLIKNGSKGENVKALQLFLNWYHPAWKLTVDKKCGPKTVAAIKSFQKTEGIDPDGEYGSNSYKKAVAYKATPKPTQTKKQAATQTQAKKAPVKPKPASPTSKTKAVAKPVAKKPAAKPKAPAKKGYEGTFPTLNNNRKIVNGMAYRMCYPYGTAQKTYKFDGGKPKPAYAKGIDKIFPTHKKWSNKRQKVGACCDVFVAVCLGYVGIKVKKDLKNQLVEMPKYKSLESNGHHKAADFRLGDVVQRGRKDKSGHTWVVCELVNGKRYVANAHYKHLKGCYAVMDAKPKDIDPKAWKYYKCYTVEGAIRTWYGIGDYGYDVLYIQQFLKWAGYFKGTCNGDYNKLTAEAVKKFQKSLGWEPNQYGICGEATIKAMRTVKR